jgi:hypothetical protein
VWYLLTLEKENLMIQLIRKYYLICIFLCAPFSTKAQLRKADSLFVAKEFRLAALEYERALFHGTNPGARNLILLKKTHCLKAQNQFKAGYENLLRADLFDSSDSVSFLLRYELVINAYLAENYDIAYNQLQQLNHFIAAEKFKFNVAYLEILLLNEMQRWTEARDKLIIYNDTHQARLNIDSLYDFIDKPKIRNLKKNEVPLMLAPGLIQVREGKPLDAVFSAAIRGSLIYLIVDQFGKHYFFSGAFSAAAIYFVFYQGAIKHATELIKNNNRKKITKYNQRIKHALITYEMSTISHSFSSTH